jgi:uncharacterized membrane protein YeiH
MEADVYNQVIAVASFAGGIAFALSGFLVGVRKNLDVVGIFILAFLTGNGGGVLRDLLTGATPAILSSMTPFWLTGGTMLVASLLRLHRRDGIERNWLFVASDGVGLVAFGITGAVTGLAAGVHFFGVLTLSLLTAVGGGMIRDMLVNEIPEVLHGGFYGSIALLLGAALYALHALGWMNPATLLAAFGLAFAMRLVAYHREWALPKMK